MPGPVPKDPEARHRRNKASTHAVLDPADAEGLKKPPLTRELIGLDKGTVHKLVQQWWARIWKSPMAPRWLEADWDGLYLIARLRHDFWTNGGTTLAAEIRQQERRFGLDIAARRSFDWRIEGATKDPLPTEMPDAADLPDEAEDPRRLLRAVK